MDKKRRIDSEEDNETFSLKNFMLLSLGYWKWFLASIIFFTGVGILYVYTRQPVYERSEEILVKDQESGGGVGDVSNSFTSLGLFANSTKTYNELIAFTSPAVMFDVVKRLDLTKNYTERKGLRKATLYGTNLPIDINMPELSEEFNVGFRMKLQPDGKFTINKIWIIEQSGKVSYDDEVSGSVDGAAVKSPIGPIEVKTNIAYVPDAPREEEMTIDFFNQAFLLAVEKYSAMLKGDLVDQDADVIELSIKDTSKERADDILSTVVEIYNERWIEDKNKVSVATSKFISDRLAVIEQDLKIVDNDIAEHKSAMKVPDVEEAAKSLLAAGLMINEQELTASTMLSMTNYLKEYVQDPANTYNVIPMINGVDNPVLDEQIGAYNELLMQRNALAENSSNDNPLVKDRDKVLAGLRAAILRSIDGNISKLQSALKTITKAHGANRDLLGNAPQQAKSLLSVERQQVVMEELYMFLLQKREETELTQKFTADNIRIITPPYGKVKPVSPKKALLIIVFFLIGLGIPAAALFISESFNTKVRSKKDMENLPLPFAGEIPHIGKDRSWMKVFKTKKKKQKEIDKPKIVVSEGKRDIPNEAFRVVRSNIDFMLAKGEKAVLALTSFNPGSGKSFVAFNLGASFALKGKKVLIIDGDLRHGSISGYVNSPHKGLATYLTGAIPDWQRLVVEAREGLYVMPIGNRPPNPAELLENGRLGTLIEEAKQDYDVILIDCPPVNIVVDTQIINQYVSRTLFVIRAGLLERKGLKDLEALVEEKKLKNITVLLNGTKTEFSSYHTYGNYEAIDKV